MDSGPEWVQRFERNVDLPSYLGQRGYQAQAEAGPGREPRDGITMANPSTGDVVVLRKEVAGTWTYTSPSAPSDRGTVSKFMMSRSGLTREEAVGRLIVLSEAVPRDSEAIRYRAFLRNNPPELQSARKEHLNAIDADRGAIGMMEKLGIPKGSFDEWRFGAVKNLDAVAKVMTDPPELWASKYRPTDRKFVLAEQPIDAIAYEKHHGKQAACYLATGRQLTDETSKKIAHVLCEVPAGVTVVLAFGADERGQRLAQEIQALAPTVKMERQAPDIGTRWSTQLQLEHRHARSLARPSQSLGR